MELVSIFDAEKYFAQYLLLSTNAFSQTHQDYLNHSAEQRDWLRDHPEIDISKLLKQAIRNQMTKDARKA
jgi:hypothetical protein